MQTCKICKLLQCACADLCFAIKQRNGNSFYIFQRVKTLAVDNLDYLLHKTNWLFNDFFDLAVLKGDQRTSHLH